MPKKPPETESSTPYSSVQLSSVVADVEAAFVSAFERAIVRSLLFFRLSPMMTWCSTGAMELRARRRVELHLNIQKKDFFQKVKAQLDNDLGVAVVFESAVDAQPDRVEEFPMGLAPASVS